MIPNKLKKLIEKYCMGVNPTDSQLDEIMNLAIELSADSNEVAAYIEKMQNGPTKEELEAELKAKAEAERKAKAEAERKAKAEAERKAKAEAERKAKAEAERKAKEEAERKAKERIKIKCQEFADYLLFNINGVQLKMIYVDGGSFMMGSPNSDYKDERPSHKVKLDSFYIGETQVTQALWSAVMEINPSNYEGEKLPVERVSWEYCQKFIKQLNILTGRTFALPTEAQWEFAARGGKKSKGYKYSGANKISDVAWYKSNSSDKTHDVAEKKANELGLYDMTGNVWEWCEDWYEENYYENSPLENPKGPNSGTCRVLRGGSSFRNSDDCRVFYRAQCEPFYRISRGIGFRLVLLV
jgi:predicted  nucleic acid-binding Zn-ribbon protein